MSSSTNNDDIITNIKLEETEYDCSDFGLANEASTHDDETSELYNSVLIEDLDSNEKCKQEINKFISSRKEKINRKNLINYCGILDTSK